MSLGPIFSTFSFIFFSAIPGRTTFVILLLATRSRPLPVLTGSVVAFLIQSLISVFLGSLLALLPHPWVNLGAGLLFLFFAFRMWRETEFSTGTDGLGLPNQSERPFLEVARNAFASVFAAEWGDVSQLAIASAAINYSNSVLVWACASSALALTAAIAVGIGSHAHRVVHPKVIHYGSLLMFGGVGFYFILEGLRKWGQS